MESWVTIVIAVSLVIVLLAFIGILGYVERKEKLDYLKQNTQLNIIKQPRYYFFVGISGLLIFVAISIIAFFFGEESEKIVWIALYVLFGSFEILCICFIVLQLNWRIEIREEEFTFRNSFRHSRTYKYNEVEVRELSRCTKFYKDGKHIVSISYLQMNWDALQKAIFEYKKHSKQMDLTLGANNRNSKA